jgi:hypothetical protein
MRNERVTKVSYGIARPVDELPWLRRRLAMRVARRMLRKMPVEGLLGLDRDGRPIWDEGYPEALKPK